MECDSSSAAGLSR